MKWYNFKDIKPPMGLEVFVKFPCGNGYITTGVYNALGGSDCVCGSNNGYGFTMIERPIEWAFIGDEETIYCLSDTGGWERDYNNSRFEINPSINQPAPNHQKRSQIIIEMMESRGQI
jgi:hypothetical protein